MVVVVAVVVVIEARSFRLALVSDVSEAQIKPSRNSAHFAGTFEDVFLTEVSQDRNSSFWLVSSITEVRVNGGGGSGGGGGGDRRGRFSSSCSCN